MEILREGKEVDTSLPVTVNCEEGSGAVVNISSTVTNNYYHYPEWFNEQLFLSVIDRLAMR